MDSLFKRTLDGEPHEHDSPQVKIQNVTYDLKESNVNLKLTVVETVGYGDQINKEDSTSSILKYIDNQVSDHPRNTTTLRTGTKQKSDLWNIALTPVLQTI